MADRVDNDGETVRTDVDVIFFESRAKNLSESADREWEAYISARPGASDEETLREFAYIQHRRLEFMSHQRQQAIVASNLAMLYELRKWMLKS